MKNFPSEKELEKMRSILEKKTPSKPLPQNANAIDLAKFYLCEKFVIYKNSHGIDQRVLAKEAGMDEALMNKILHYHYEEISVDKLIGYLSKIYSKVELKVSVA